MVQGEGKALEFDDFEEWIMRSSSFPLIQLIDLDAAMGFQQIDINAVGPRVQAGADAW